MKTRLPEVLELAQRRAAADPTMLVELYTARDQRLVWASPSHADILGYDSKALVGRHWHELIDPADHAHKTLLLTDSLLTGDTLETGLHFIAADGSQRYIEVLDTFYADPDTEEQYVICRSTQIEPPSKPPKAFTKPK